ncbi:hypothetical protein OSTOST_23042, partial [Ostertagia ostertagi]
VFAAVVPETTVVALKKFDKLKAERLQRLKDRLSEQTELMDGDHAREMCWVTFTLDTGIFHKSLNKPGTGLHPRYPIDRIIDFIEQVKAAGGVANMRKKLDELTVLHKRNNDLVADIDRILIEENRSDVDLRHQLRSERVRITSDELVGPFVQELSKHLGDLKQATEVDKALRTLFSSNEKAIDMLSKSEEIHAKLASPVGDDVKAEMNEFLKIDDDEYITEQVEKVGSR